MSRNGAHGHAVLQAYKNRDRAQLVLLAWISCGSWDWQDICMELESLTRQAWGDRWEAMLVDLQIHTTRLVRQTIPQAQALQERITGGDEPRKYAAAGM